MSEFVLQQQNEAAVEQQKPKEMIRRLVWKICIATLILMAIGSATRVMNAGLACPDWPLCYGELVPAKQMNLQVFLEWFHRLDAALIGLSAIALFGLSWWHRRVLPRWLPWASTFALFLIVFQGILGGLTVTELLRFDIVTAHLGTALLFFSTLLIIGTALTPYQGNGTVGKLPWGRFNCCCSGLPAKSLGCFGRLSLGATPMSRRFSTLYCNVQPYCWFGAANSDNLGNGIYLLADTSATSSLAATGKYSWWVVDLTNLVGIRHFQITSPSRASHRLSPSYRSSFARYFGGFHGSCVT
jgi:heme A synthase